MKLPVYLALLSESEKTLADSFRVVAEAHGDEPERLHAAGVGQARSGPLGMLRDLQDLYLLASLTDITWTAVKQAGQALRDQELLDIVAECDGETSVQLRWLRTRMKHAAPQVLIAAG